MTPVSRVTRIVGTVCVLAAALAFGVGQFVQLAQQDAAEGTQGAQVAWGARVLLSLIGLILLLLFLWRVPAWLRHLAVTRDRPEAIVVECFGRGVIAAQLARANPAVDRDEFGTWYTLSLSAHGWEFWSGGPRPELICTVPLQAVVEIRPEPTVDAVGWPVPGVAIVVRHRMEDDLEPEDLVLNLWVVGPGWWGLRGRTRSGVERLSRRLRELWHQLT